MPRIDVDDYAAIIECRLAIAAQVGLLRGLPAHAASGRELARAVDQFETGLLWLREAIDVTAEDVTMGADCRMRRNRP
jgi:hypothetical protein